VTDFEYDVMQKKRLSRGAYHKKNGSKSRRCTLPSDYLTAAQRKELNGDVKEYNLSKPMSWEAFKAMPLDLQQDYVNRVQSRFGVGVTTMSRDLFGLSGTALRQYLKRAGLKSDNTVKGGRPDLNIHWLRWLGEDKVKLDPLEEVTPCEDSPVAVVPCEDSPIAVASYEDSTETVEDAPTPREEAFRIDHLTTEFHGEFDPAKFMLFLSRFPMPSGKVRIRMEVTAE
jgi:hypothetical protein